MKDLIYTILWIAVYAASAVVAIKVVPYYRRWQKAIDEWCKPRRRYWERKYKWEADPPVSLPSVLSDPRCIDQMHIPRSKHSK